MGVTVGNHIVVKSGDFFYALMAIALRIKGDTPTGSSMMPSDATSRASLSLLSTARIDFIEAVLADVFNVF